MPITHIRVVTVYVRDQEAALAFYRDQLGFEERRNVDMGKGRWIEVAPQGAGDTVLMLADAAAFGQDDVGGFAPCTLECDDAETTRAELAERGVDVSEVEREHWGTHFFANDPDGTKFLIRETPKS